jgi:vacuolar-type H+-ATPase subunit E/Vma4
MKGLTVEADQALAPVREWLLAAARQEARSIEEAAGRQAVALVEQARADAAAALERGRREGEDAAAEAAARELARSRREARAIVLRARADLLARVREAVRGAAAELRAEESYPLLVERLRRRATATLGEAARVSEAPEGGVRARLGSRQVDLSLPILAERALRDLEAEVSSLWS